LGLAVTSIFQYCFSIVEGAPEVHDDPTIEVFKAHFRNSRSQAAMDTIGGFGPAGGEDLQEAVVA